jgi:hypothetical protein
MNGQRFIVVISYGRGPWGVNKVITRATETGRNKMVSMSARKRPFAADFSAIPRHAETLDRRF